MSGTNMLARVFALCTDEEQAEFLNEAGAALHRLCRQTEAGEDMQLFRISDKLNDNGKRLIKKLYEMTRPD